jgi:hypothetical protein
VTCQDRVLNHSGIFSTNCPTTGTLTASLASLPGLPEIKTTGVVLDKLTKETRSQEDPTTVRQTSYSLLAKSCVYGERKLTYLVELTERGPNIRPGIPTDKESDNDRHKPEVTIGGEQTIKRRRKSDTPVRIAPKEVRLNSTTSKE